jgi:hypothetical protein
MTSAVHVRALSVQANGMLRKMQQRKLNALAISLKRLRSWMCHSTANACFKDAADLHAELEEYQIAVARYDQVASHSLNSALTKYSVKDYWFKALLCVLATSVRRRSSTSCPIREIPTRTMSVLGETWTVTDKWTAHSPPRARVNLSPRSSRHSSKVTRRLSLA